MSHLKSDRGWRTSRGPPTRIRITLNFGLFGTATWWLMDPVGEEQARLCRGRYPTNKRLSVLEFIERSLGIYLQRPLRVHSQVLMESTNVPGTQFSRFYFTSLLPDSSWREIAIFNSCDRRISILKLHFLASLTGNYLKRNCNQLCSKYYIGRKYWHVIRAGIYL